MNEPSVKELVEQSTQTTTNLDFFTEKENNASTSQNISEVMQSSNSSVRIDRFPSTLKINTHGGFIIAENCENKIKELWSAEELTANLVNKTAMKIANLKQKLDEQLKNIEILQKSEDKCRNSLKSIPEPHKTDHKHHIPEQDSGVSNNTGKMLTMKKERKVMKQKSCKGNGEGIAKKKRSGSIKPDVQKPTVSQIKRKRRPRGVSLKRFCYRPFAMDCSSSLPEKLTKEQFLRQLRLIPGSYLLTQNSQE